MSFSIEKHGIELLVRIEHASADKVFETLCSCRSQSWWSCPSGECVHIGAGDTRHEGTATVLALTPRPGETLSVTGIQECLRYVLLESASERAGN